ncbi:MAG TPA: 1-phosphofructokinase family hexose kinase [Solirubrobacterales bacterium]|jgi:1-phosphofructokinase/tagatose 6-phosphate kinase|nr:1-phosphofructokinase family hexose kinase [Solirubrobacterales bacterium]
MIISVTLNAAIDRTVAVPNLRLGHRHRSVETRTVPGGKGINVARALGLLGRPVIATGLVGGGNGDRVLKQLGEEGLLTDFIRIAEETRFNLALVDPTTGEQTEVNERGPRVSPEELDSFIERLDYLASGASLCVLAGSLPPGIDVEFYARLVETLRQAGLPVLLDSEGEAMSAGMRAGPDMITPNKMEAEELVGHEFDTREEMLDVLAELVDMGPAEAAITLPEGCVAIVGEGPNQRILEAVIEPLEPISTVGSGDAFVAGYIAARYDGGTPEDCLAYGVACGAESTQHLGAGRIDRGRAESLLGNVEVRQLQLPAEV